MVKLIKLYEDNKEFLDMYEEFFTNDEVRYGLIYGIAKRKEIVTLIIESRIKDDFIIGVLAGKNLIIASNTNNETVYEELIDYLDDDSYPGIIGLKEHCFIFNRVYEKKYNRSLKVEMDQRIYYCTSVTDEKRAESITRYARVEDLDILVDWAIAFSIDVEGSSSSAEEKRKHLLEKIENNHLYVLEVDGSIVSMTARTRALLKTESVGYVYTPDHLRGNGYASKIVADVTREVIEDGKDATLYTDLSNPTSNSIYMKIGYQPYCDSVVLVK